MPRFALAATRDKRARTLQQILLLDNHRTCKAELKEKSLLSFALVSLGVIIMLVCCDFSVIIVAVAIIIATTLTSTIVERRVSNQRKAAAVASAIMIDASKVHQKNLLRQLDEKRHLDSTFLLTTPPSFHCGLPTSAVKQPVSMSASRRISLFSDGSFDSFLPPMASSSHLQLASSSACRGFGEDRSREAESKASASSQYYLQFDLKTEKISLDIYEEWSLQFAAARAWTENVITVQSAIRSGEASKDRGLCAISNHGLAAPEYSSTGADFKDSVVTYLIYMPYVSVQKPPSAHTTHACALAIDA
jgi:hypothetical protein